MPKALIVPHAGYIYSGPIAASAYASLAAALDVAPIEIARIVLIGPAHRVYVPSIASAGAEVFQTPLGPAEVDLAWLSRARGITANPRAHEREHCLEVQLPFLQRILPRTRIVPLLVSDAPADWVAGVLGELYGGPETLLIISSDLSHYLPYEMARHIDTETARRIASLDGTLSGEQACGAAAINGLLHLGRQKGMRAQLLDLRNSGDTAGMHDEVVGYAAFTFYEDAACHN